MQDKGVLFFLALVAAAAWGPDQSLGAVPPGTESRLILTSGNAARWMSSAQIDELLKTEHSQSRCGTFMDITDHQIASSSLLPVSSFMTRWEPEKLHPQIVEPLLGELDAQKLYDTVAKLSSFDNRFSTSDSGARAAQWILDKFHTDSAGRSDIDARPFKHKFTQPSVIAEIKGQGHKANEIVIIGAHEDSITRFGFRAPGADDDASGVATVLEVFRVLAQSGFRPNRTVQFVTYAGEERGLLGSQDIAAQYRSQNKAVVAVMQLDMTMYPGSGQSTFVFLVDNVSADLTNYVKMLSDQYVKMNWRDDQCGYPCSDHASWSRNGYASVFPFESLVEHMNREIHTPNDTTAQIDHQFGLAFAKLGLAFAVELGIGE